MQERFICLNKIFPGLPKCLGAAMLAAMMMAPGVTLATVSEHDVMALRDLALSGERAAVRELFASLPHASGAVAEEIDDILGRLARHHPRLLLEEMQRSKGGRESCANLGNTVDLTDQTTAQIRELDARRAALLTVRGAALQRLRNACVQDLDADLRIMRNAERAQQTQGQD